VLKLDAFSCNAFGVDRIHHLAESLCSYGAEQIVRKRHHDEWLLAAGISFIKVRDPFVELFSGEPSRIP